MGYKGRLLQGSSEAGEALGIAVQLVNIFRDVYEDALQGRVYLPPEDFGKKSLDPKWILNASPSELRPGLERLKERIELFFAKAEPLVNYVEEDARLTALLIPTAYKTMLSKTYKNLDHLKSVQSIKLSKSDKVLILLKVIRLSISS